MKANFLSAPVSAHGMGNFPVQNGELACRDPRNYWAGINNSLKLVVVDGILQIPEGFSQEDLGQELNCLVRRDRFCLVFWEKKKDGFAPVVLGQHDGRIEGEYYERFKKLAREYIAGGSQHWEDHEYEFERQSHSGFAPLVEGTNIVDEGLTPSLRGYIQGAGRLFEEVHSVTWREKTLLSAAEVKAALEGLTKLEAWQPRLIPLAEAQFFGLAVRMDYKGSESLSGEEAFAQLNFNSITPTGFGVQEIPTGYILRRRLGNQFILKGTGSWFICEPRRAVLKTLTAEAVAALKRLIQETMERNWNATSYNCPEFFPEKVVPEFSSETGIPEGFEGVFHFKGTSGVIEGEYFQNSWMPFRVRNFDAAQEIATAFEVSVGTQGGVLVDLKPETFHLLPETFEGEFGFEGMDNNFLAEKRGNVITVPSLGCKRELALQGKYEVKINDYTSRLLW